MNHTNLAQKSTSKFQCLTCDYYSSNINHYNRHLMTEKHKKSQIIQNNTNLGQKGQLDKTFSCDCGKSYKHKTNLYTHKKKCNFNDQIVLKNIENEIMNEKINYKELINELINQNKQFQDIFIEQNKKIIELSEKPTTIINNNNSITNNQNLNINMFLNEKCKDAIHIDDFVNTINVSVDDLLFIKDKGIVKGVANIINQNLIELPIHKRPIWCSDKKRKKIFLKQNQWTEDIDNYKTKQVINDVTRIQSKNIAKYQQKYPINDEKQRDTFIQIVSKNTESISGKQDAIINNIIDTIYFDQNNKIINEEAN